MRKAVVKRSPADMREREVITVREISNNMPLYRRRNTISLPYAVEPAAMRLPEIGGWAGRMELLRPLRAGRHIIMLAFAAATEKATWKYRHYLLVYGLHYAVLSIFPNLLDISCSRNATIFMW